MGIASSLKLFAQRTVQPHRVLGRNIAIFNAALLGSFLLLTLARLWLVHPSCPEIRVAAAGQARLMVPASCVHGQWLTSFGTSIVDNLAAGLIVAMVSSLLLWLISPKDMIDEDIAALAPWNIHEVLHRPLAETKDYWFRGRSGRFMRSAVMPALDEAGRREGQQRRFSMLLPDPSDTAMLADYAHYRNSLERSVSWTVDRIRNEVLATIILAARLSNANHFFEARAFLKSDFSLFRLDMSDDQLVMTREDPKWPGILCSKNSKFYASYLEEFRNEAKKATEVNLTLATVPTPITGPDVNAVLVTLGLSINLSGVDGDAVADAVEHPELPYA